MIEITDEAVHAAAMKFVFEGGETWAEIGDERRGFYMQDARSALEAAIPFLREVSGE